MQPALTQWPPTDDWYSTEEGRWHQRLVRIRKLREDAVIPVKGTHRSAGFDLTILDDIEIEPSGRHLAKLGLVVAAPPSHMLLVVPRSSTFKTWGVTLGNTVGIVDEDFSGDEDELCLYLHNPDAYRPKRVPALTRLAQGIFVPVSSDFTWEEVDTMGPSRGGWGSTGQH